MCLLDLLPEILRRGWKPFLIAPGRGALVTRMEALGVTTIDCSLGSYSSGSKSGRDLIRFVFEIPRLAAAIRDAVARHSIDLLYVNGPRVLAAVVGIDRPVIFHAHNAVGGANPARLAEWCVRRTRATVIAASQFVARRYPGAHVIYNGIADLGRGPRSFTREPACVGILGRIAPEKGHLDFVRAAQLTENVVFRVHGDRLFSDAGYDREVRAQAGSLVEFRGWTDDVAAVLNDVDVLAVPSGSAEAATRVIMEAFSAGTPVIAYRAGGIPELIDDGRTGILTHAPDAESLAASIGELVSDRDRMQRLSIAGREEWRQRFQLGLFRTKIGEVLARCDVHERGKAESAAAIAGENDFV